jgi:hypothetical protein
LCFVVFSCCGIYLLLSLPLADGGSLRDRRPLQFRLRAAFFSGIVDFHT